MDWLQYFTLLIKIKSVHIYIFKLYESVSNNLHGHIVSVVANFQFIQRRIKPSPEQRVHLHIH